MENNLFDLPPLTSAELEKMWENAPPCGSGTTELQSIEPVVMQFQNEPSEPVQLDSLHLCHFTPEQVANLWSATMQMQREVYRTHQSRHEQQYVDAAGAVRIYTEPANAKHRSKDRNGVHSAIRCDALRPVSIWVQPSSVSGRSNSVGTVCSPDIDDRPPAYSPAFS